MEHAGIADLLDRLQDLNVKVDEKDLSSNPPTPALSRVAGHLADAVLSSTAPTHEVQEAVQGVQHASHSRPAQLDESLAKLDAALDGNITSKRTRIQLLERLTAYVQARRLIAHSNASQAPIPAADEASQALRDISSLVQVDAGSNTAKAHLDAMNQSVAKMLQQLPATHFDPLVPADSLSPEQRDQLKAIYEALREEYTVRRRMLLERAKVTLQSFLWTDRLTAQGTAQQAKEAAVRSQAALSPEPAVAFEDVFEARAGDVAAVMSKATSGNKGKFEASAKSFLLLGEVPDRGGRCEGRAAGGSMPQWAPRTAPSGTAGRGAGSKKAGGRRGGRSHAGSGGS